MKCLWFLVLFSVAASASLNEKVRDLLPSTLQQLKLHTTNPTVAQKVLGKAHLIEGSKYYWEQDGYKYAVILVFDEKKLLQSIHYTFPSERPGFSKIGELNVDKFVPYPDDGKGRLFLLKEKNFELIVDPVSKTIRTVKLI